jgi:hypothetical protein
MEILKKPFIIYNQKTLDSFIILNINEQKKYLFYYNWNNKERTIQFVNNSDNIKKKFIY